MTVLHIWEVFGEENSTMRKISHAESNLGYIAVFEFI